MKWEQLQFYEHLSGVTTLKRTYGIYFRYLCNSVQANMGLSKFLYMLGMPEK